MERVIRSDSSDRPRLLRKAVHELAKCYGLSSISKNNEPHKYALAALC